MLNLLLKRLCHVVAQIIEAELGVRAVCDVSGVSGELLTGILHVLQDAPAESKPVVNWAHPLGVTAGEVVVDGDEVDALVGERVEADGQRRRERLAFAGLHLGDVAAVEHHAADQLDVKVTHVEEATTGLTDDRETLRQHAVERLALLADALSQSVHPAAQLLVTKRN